MSLYLFAGFVSCLVHFLLIIPFINFLYKLKFQRATQKTKDAFNKPTPIFDKFHQHKQGTPVGGGILIIVLTTLLFCYFLLFFTFINKPLSTSYPSVLAEIKILLFSFISFALLGIYDDLSKIFFWKKNGFFGLRMRAKLILEVILALIIAYWLYSDLKIDIIYVPFLGLFQPGVFYIVFAAFVIVAFANAVNITDGLDGLASGVLMIAITAFWIVARTIIDVPTSIFIAIWLGGLVAFLYFNIYPARIFLGDTGALSFGATFAVVGLILGKVFALPIIGGIFVIEIASSLVQLLSKRFLKRKIMPVSPIHLLLQRNGWEEPKIVMRFWILSIVFSLFGLMIAFMK
ncbi:phospho-N-acetylmuramoyl-pentapeptide-transferase [Candidatus Roizmanbacteria bacterium]|nr:phospho-N-acetylmuramoyl-pentapeptide-transferase [Candidatus Roizmanbacteria bacterium]